MRTLHSYGIAAAMAALATLPPALFIAAPTASAECTETNGITMCQNEVRRGDSAPPEDKVWYPYPCEVDYLCDDGVNVIVGDIDPPDRPDNLPDFGRPGRPGNRPDGGGGRGGIGNR